ncbi:hypothetical protein [Kineococcus auxinigenes]|uniref:hypothetical protein n=1 Tax=unclassified Kineococcus TaxID=2621656 RepID=UPI003D7D1C35
MLHRTGAPASLLQDLTSGGLHAVLASVDDPARQFLAPLVADERMPPHHQHPVLQVDHCRDGDPLKPDNVVFEAGAIRGPNVNLHQMYPRVLVERALSEYLLAHLLER